MIYNYLSFFILVWGPGKAHRVLYESHNLNREGFSFTE
jgi:hypothetical protein